MSLTISRKEKEDKVDLIIRSAQERFGIYGFEKTSMQEIAGDLHMSKGSLYYYFPDKENLYKAVIEKEQSEFLKILRKIVRDINDPEECLRKYSSTRLAYFKALLNLTRIRPEALTEMQPLISQTFSEFREQEKKIIIQILEKGKQLGKFHFKDPYESASLFLDILRGIRGTILNNKKLLVIEEAEFKELSVKIMAVTDMFIKSLKHFEE